LNSSTDPATQPSAVKRPSAASWDDLLRGVAAPWQLDEAAQLDAAVDEIGF
jgi:hypothetical protein